MCGIIALAGYDDVIQDLYDGLVLLQHRGQDAAGIVTYDDQFHLKKANGMVQEVFHSKSIDRLRGRIGIGHVRYPTAGCNSEFEAQPFFVNSPFGIALAHNGNLTNAAELGQELLQEEFCHLNTTSDSEVLLNVFAQALRRQRPKKLSPELLFRAMRAVYRRCKGSYACVALIGGQGIIGFRDAYGIRPLAIGKRKFGMKEEYIICSENAAMEPLGFEFLRDVEPGEVIFVDRKNQMHTRVCRRGELHPCIFEWVYLAAQDSLIDRVSVYKARVRMGELLARQIKNAGLKIDSVIPIPDTSRAAAAGISDALNIRYREAFVKNRYIGRTFIMPGQHLRQRSVHFKIHPIKLEFRKNNVLLVDDSIVRGNTMRKIVEMARTAGARKVYVAIACPPLRSPCPYGVDMPTYDEFIAHERSIEEVRKLIGADALFYGKMEDLIASVRRGNPRIKSFCTGCMNKRYPTPEVNKRLLLHMGRRRSHTRDSGSEGEENEGAGLLSLV